MDYKYIIVDSNNLGYMLINSVATSRDLTRINSKIIYKSFVKSFMETISHLQAKYNSQEVILLFDNHTSREELKKAFTIASGCTRKDIKNTYKSSRKKETKEFYTSLDFLKYYYMICEPTFHTAQVWKLEADDLVSPCLSSVVKEDSALLVTNDSDWTKYLSDKVHYLPDVNGTPKDTSYFYDKYKFFPTEDKVVLYKILFGDQADDIPVLFPEFNKELRYQILQDFETVFDFILQAPSTGYLKNYFIMIKEREADIKINYQLISAIPVTAEQLKYNFTTGRNSEILMSAVKTILYGAPEGASKFEFGGLCMPRVSP